MSPEYVAWRSMNQRCTNPNHKDFDLYKDRGVCAEWRASFQAFLDHIGPRPSSEHSVERMNNDRGYEPGNVRWATRLEQGKNKRNNFHIERNGEDVVLAELARSTGIPWTRIRHRIKSGWSVEETLSRPPKDERSTMTGAKLAAERRRIGLTQAALGRLVEPPLQKRRISVLERSTLPISTTMASRLRAALAKAGQEGTTPA